MKQRRVGIIAVVVIAAVVVSGVALTFYVAYRVRLHERQHEILEQQYKSRLLVTITRTRLLGSYLMVHGSVTNDGDELVTTWQLRVFLTSTSGTPLDSQRHVSTEPLPAGRAKSFELTMPAPTGPADVSAEVERVQLAE